MPVIHAVHRTRRSAIPTWSSGPLSSAPTPPSVMPARCPLVQIGSERLGPRTAPRADACLQGRRHAAHRTDVRDRVLAGASGDRVTIVGRHVRRYRLCGHRSVPGTRASGGCLHPLPARPGVRGAAAPDDNPDRGECPRASRSKGTFDDCQDAGEGDVQRFHRSGTEVGLAAVNSINWARILAQVGLLHVTAAVALGAPAPEDQLLRCRQATSATSIAGHVAKTDRVCRSTG